VTGRIDEAHAVQGVKIFAKGLEKAIAGSSLWVVNYCGNRKETEQELKKRVMDDLNNLMNHWGRSPTGVYVQGIVFICRHVNYLISIQFRIARGTN
jgi:translation initiation factor IF-2